MSDNYLSDKISLLTSSDHFFSQLETDIQNARDSVKIQCMSFEADKVGRKLIEFLQAKPDIDRTILIDSYSKYVVNDTFLPSPFGLFNKNNALKERMALNPLIKEARKSGIEIRFTNPVGFMLSRYPYRNHKKLILIDDDISYLGGVNFTEHNFRWKDMMIRHTDAAINSNLHKSFQADLNREKVSPVHTVDQSTVIYILNGRKTKGAYEQILSLISGASKIVAISPYISYPFLDAISAVADHKVILPENNNKTYVSLLHRLPRYDSMNFEYAQGEMVHMKLLILDDETVIYGSSNFDTASYLFEKEILLQKKDPSLVTKLNSIANKLINPK